MATLRLVPASGSPIELTSDALVGRDPSCEIVAADGSVSRKHAKIELRGNTWMVVDQGSANGTFVDSRKVGEEPLRHGQELRFGAVAYKVEIPGEEDLGATVAHLPAMRDDATVVQPSPAAPATPGRAGGPPPLPKPSSPPPPPPRPAASVPPPPPSAAAAKERFRSAAPAAPVGQIPAQGGGPAPAKKGKGPVFWIVTGCCGCLLLGALLAGLLGGGAFLMTKGASDAAHTVVREIKTGQIDQAYQGLSQSLRAEMTLQDFERMIAEHPGLRDNVDATFPNRSIKNDTATIAGVLVSSSGPPEPVVFTLVKEGGDWKVSEIRFGAE